MAKREKSGAHLAVHVMRGSHIRAAAPLPSPSFAATSAKKKKKGKDAKASGAKRAAIKRKDDRMRYDDVDPDLFGSDRFNSDKLPRSVEPLKFKKINEGMFLMGVVKEVGNRPTHRPLDPFFPTA